MLTLLSANLSGNICATPDGEVIVFAFTGLVDGFVLKKFTQTIRCWLVKQSSIVNVTRWMILRESNSRVGTNCAFRWWEDKTYLLNDDSFNGSCCLIPDATFGELAEPTKLTGEGLFAAGELQHEVGDG